MTVGVAASLTSFHQAMRRGDSHTAAQQGIKDLTARLLVADAGSALPLLLEVMRLRGEEKAAAPRFPARHSIGRILHTGNEERHREETVGRVDGKLREITAAILDGDADGLALAELRGRRARLLELKIILEG